MVDNNDSVIFREHSNALKRYCSDNNLSSGKLFDSCCCYNNEKGRLFIMGEGDPERGKLGLMDDVPLPVALEIYLENGKLRFVQTDITHQYLGIMDASSPVAMPKAAVA